MKIKVIFLNILFLTTMFHMSFSSNSSYIDELRNQLHAKNNNHFYLDTANNVRNHLNQKLNRSNYKYDSLRSKLYHTKFDIGVLKAKIAYQQLLGSMQNKPNTPQTPASCLNYLKTKATLPTVLATAKVAGIALVGGGAYVLAYKLNHDQKTVEAEALVKQIEETRLANRSYVEMFKDSASTFGTKVSKLAQSAKANTWDTNAGFKHSGKVATIAGVAAVVGLSYLAKQKLFGKAVVKTVAPKVTVVNKRNRIRS